MTVAHVDVLSELREGFEGQKPWADFVFDVTDVTVDGPETSSPGVAFRAVARHVDDIVGFEVRIPTAGWETTNDGIEITWGALILKSIGDPTDRLLSLYEEWWDRPRTGAPAASTITAFTAGLGDDPRDVLESMVHSKMFFEPVEGQPGEAYAELYLNFDIPNRRAWLAEKDAGYRSAVLWWLSNGACGLETMQ